MKKNALFTGLLTMGIAFVVSSCGEEVAPGREGTGSIVAYVDVDASLLTADVSSRALEAVSVDDLSLTITSADGSYSKTWQSVSDFSSDEQFPIGNYTVEVAHGTTDDEGFDAQAAFHGSSDVKVIEGVKTPVSVTACLAHAMVSVDYTDDFKNYLQSATVDLMSASGKTAATYRYVNGGEATAGPAYIKPGEASLIVDLIKKNGVKGSGIEAATFVAEARHHYHITLDVEGGAGNAVMKVAFDDEVMSETIDVDLSDEVLSAPAPELFLSIDETELSLVEGFYKGPDVKMTVLARGGIRSVELSTRSTYLVDMKSWPEVIDLVTGDRNQIGRIVNLGLKGKGLWTGADKMAEINFTDVVRSIACVEGDTENNVSTFTVKVTDVNGKVTQTPVSFSVAVEPVNVAISNLSEIAFFQTTSEVDLDFNGFDPDKTVDFYCYHSDRGSHIALAAESKDRGNGKYHVALSGLPADVEAITVVAECGGKLSSIEALRQPGEYSVKTLNGEYDVFAKRALVTLESDDMSPEQMAGIASFWLVDGEDAVRLNAVRQSGATFMVEGLTPSSSNKIAASLTGSASQLCDPITVVTEAAGQLPNSDMEDWFRVAGKTQYWWVDYPGIDTDAVWGTLNLLTTSVGDNKTSMFSHKGTSYCAFSGTRPTTDRYSGKNAAIISTVGWGDNDANGSTSTGKGCKNLTVGELYLGRYNAETKSADYTGLDFKSRPTALAFYYKYTVKNAADYGYVEIMIKDAGGNVIAKGESTGLKANDSYVLANVPLSYTNYLAKASKIYVVFKSSGNPDCQTINTTNLSCPPFGNLSDGRFTGSELYVDGIQLIY